MEGGLGNGNSEGGHTGLVCYSDNRGQSHLGPDLARAGGSCSVQGETGEPWVSNQEGFMEEQSGQQGWKRMEGQSWGGFSLGVRGRQLSWPG